jgi:hypothetical protein
MIKKTLFINGCAGFIGPHAVEKFFSLGYNVIGLDNFDGFYSWHIKETNLSISLNSQFFELIDGNQKLILEAINNNPKISHSKLSELFQPVIEKSINKLKLFGLLKCIGTTKSGYWEVLK